MTAKRARGGHSLESMGRRHPGYRDWKLFRGNSEPYVEQAGANQGPVHRGVTIRLPGSTSMTAAASVVEIA